MQTKQVFEYKQKSRKMNVKSNMIAAAVSALMLAACHNEDVTPGTETGQDLAHFSATITQPVTRAYDQIWEANDGTGISGTSGDVTYTNVRYLTTDASGNFNPEDESKKIYFQDNSEVTFTAYYPWNDLKGSTTITADTWGQKEQKNFDFLWAQAKGSKEHPDVAFTFAHKMAKVVLTVKCGADVSYDEVKAAVLTLDGFKHEGSFNVTTGTAEVTGNESVMWEFAGNTENEVYNAPFKYDDEKQTVSYTLIFFPQVFDAALPFTAELTGKQSFTADLNFTSANAEIDKANAKNEWVAGRQYNMGVVLNKTGIKVEGCTIAPWEEVSLPDDIPAM